MAFAAARMIKEKAKRPSMDLQLYPVSHHLYIKYSHSPLTYRLTQCGLYVKSLRANRPSRNDWGHLVCTENSFIFFQTLCHNSILILIADFERSINIFEFVTCPPHKMGIFKGCSKAVFDEVSKICH